MKKFLAMGLGSLMVAAPAGAAGHIDFSGYYRLMYMSETNTSYSGGSKSFTDAYFQDRLNLDLTFRPTDEIAVHWRLRGPGSYQRLGAQDPKIIDPLMDPDLIKGRDTGLYTDFIYGEIKQDWGTVLIGRLSDDLDVYGLASLGYQPSTIDVFTNTGPFDRADILDGIRYSHTWDNGFSLMAQYGKLSNDNRSGGRVYSYGSDAGRDDEDRDQFRVEAAYTWDGGGASLGLFYDRDASSYPTPGSGLPYCYRIPIPYRNPGDVYYVYRSPYEQWGLNPALRHSWGDFSFHFEALAQWGRAKYLSKDSTRDPSGNRVKGPAVDSEGFGAYLDFDYNYGPGNITLAAWWASGSGLDAYYKDGGKNRSDADLVGGNFYPLLVAYNGTNLNPGGNRHYAGTDPSIRVRPAEASRQVSAIGFANNAYMNYVLDGHLGRVIQPDGMSTTYGNNSNATFSYQPLQGNGVYYAINDTMGVDLNPHQGGSVYIFHRDVLSPSSTRTRTASFNENTDANHWAIALTGNHAFTDDITMHYGLAYLALNNPNYRISNGAVYSDTSYNGTDPGWTNTSFKTQDKDLGFEIDLGFTFQLLDNLKFSTAFGYMFNGDAYKRFKGYKLHMVDGTRYPGIPGTVLPLEGDRISGVWQDADDSYVWFNSLTFEF